LPVGVLLAAWIGPWMEQALFGGDFLHWLDGRGTERFGGWVLLSLPVSAVLVVLFGSRVVNPWVHRRSAGWSRARCARFDAAKFVVGIAASVALSLAIAFVMDGLWIDPRGVVLDTYVQR